MRIVRNLNFTKYRITGNFCGILRSTPDHRILISVWQSLPSVLILLKIRSQPGKNPFSHPACNTTNLCSFPNGNFRFLDGSDDIHWWEAVFFCIIVDFKNL
jgi:hypothetical protein